MKIQTSLVMRTLLALAMLNAWLSIALALPNGIGPALPDSSFTNPSGALVKQPSEDAALAMPEAFRLKSAAFNSRLMFMPGTDRLVVAQTNGEVKLVRVPQGDVAATFGGLDGQALCLAASANGAKIFAGTETGSIFVWQDGLTNAQIVFHRNGWPVTALASSPAGSLVVGACNGKYVNGTWQKPEQSLLAVDVMTGKTLWKSRAGRADYQALSYAGDGKTLAAVQNAVAADFVALLDPATGHVLDRFTSKGHPRGPLSVAGSSNGKLYAVGYAPNDIGIWDTATGKCLRMIPAHKNWVVTLAFSPDGSLLASGAGDSTSCIWEVATGREVGEISFHGVADEGRYVQSVSISSDGRWLAAGCQGECVVAKMPEPLGK